MIKQLLTVGVKKLALFLAIIFSVLFTNAFLLGVNIWFMWEEGIHLGEWLRLVMVLAFFFAAGFYTIWKIYGVLAVEAFKQVYIQFTPQIKELSEKVVRSIKKSMDGKVLDSSRAMNDQLKKMPWVFRFPMKLLIKRIPLLKLIDNTKENLLKKKEEAAVKQFNKDLDDYIQEAYLEATELKWVISLIGVMMFFHGVMGYFLTLS